jgi:hypothetical protein
VVVKAAVVFGEGVGVVARRKVDGVPEETARVARASFPKGSLAMRIRDELGELFQDTDFAGLYPSRGKPAWSPGTPGVSFWTRSLRPLRSAACSRPVAVRARTPRSCCPPRG